MGKIKAFMMVLFGILVISSYLLTIFWEKCPIQLSLIGVGGVLLFTLIHFRTLYKLTKKSKEKEE